MRKGTKIAVAAALICMVSGAVIVACTLAAVSSDFSRLNTVRFDTNTYEVKESFSNIRINGAECDVRLAPAQDDTCKVVCSESDKLFHTVTVDDGTLTITRTDEREWYKNIGVYWDETSITVYLPAREYTDLFIKSLSGDISVPGDFTFSQAEIYNTSGEIEYSAVTGHGLTVQTTSGDLSVRNLTAGEVKAQSTSGTIEISNVTVSDIHAVSTSGDVTIQSSETKNGILIETVSGEIELEHLNPLFVTAYSSSGDIDLSNVLAAGQMEIETVSGEIELERCDAQDLTIRSVSGDVSGTLLSEKWFTTNTTSGSVNVPQAVSLPAGTCEVHTASGNIYFKLAAKGT